MIMLRSKFPLFIVVLAGMQIVLFSYIFLTSADNSKKTEMYESEYLSFEAKSSKLTSSMTKEIEELRRELEILKQQGVKSGQIEKKSDELRTEFESFKQEMKSYTEFSVSSVVNMVERVEANEYITKAELETFDMMHSYRENYNELSTVEIVRELSKLHRNPQIEKRVILVSFAHGCCEYSLPRILNTSKIAGFDDVHGLKMNDLPQDFVDRHANIFKEGTRGGGYFVWKPRVILETMRKYPLSENVLILYADAGFYFDKNLKFLFDDLYARSDLDIFSWELGECCVNHKYTKSDTFLFMNCDTEECHKVHQRGAGFVFVKNTIWARFVVQQWARHAETHYLSTDMKNVLGKPNSRNFTAHRHDQSILSSLYHKYNIPKYDNWGANFEHGALVPLDRNKT